MGGERGRGRGRRVGWMYFAAFVRDTWGDVFWVVG